jgi:hypothetical protein
VCFHCNTKFMCVWMPWMFVILWCAPRGWQLDCRNVCMGYKYTLLIILVQWLVWLKLMTECTVRVNKNSFNTSFFQITVGLRLSQSVTLQAAPPLGGPGKAGCITVLCQKCFVCKFLYCFICIFGSWLHVGGAYFCVEHHQSRCLFLHRPRTDLQVEPQSVISFSTHLCPHETCIVDAGREPIYPCFVGFKDICPGFS